MINPPIKRHAALVPFSRDHNVGLYHAKRLRQAAAGLEDPAAAWSGFYSVWTGEIEDHFHDEERELSPLIEDAALVGRLLADHARLHALVSIARDSDDAHRLGAYEELGAALQDHIRWEERELFMMIQEQSGEMDLARLHLATNAMEAGRPASRARGGRDRGPDEKRSA